MPSNSTITTSLPPELTAFVADKARTGYDRSASEVVRDALCLLVEQDRRQKRKLDQRTPTAGEPDAR